MNNVKKYLFRTVFFAGVAIVYLLLLSLLHHFGVLHLSNISTINFVVIAILSLLVGLMMGKKTSKKGYLEGLKLGGIAILILGVLNVLFYRHFDLYVFLYYLVILASSTIGSMVGINLRH